MKRSERADGWGARVKILGFLLLYTTGLWGQAGRLLPAPFSDWHDIPYRLLAPWWHALAPRDWPLADQVMLFAVIAGYVLALAVPLLFLRRLGIGAAAAGLGWTRQHGAAITWSGVLLSVPVGFWLVAVTPDPWAGARRESLEYLSLLPEHFLVFGVLGVLLAPNGRLAWVGGGVGWFAVLGAALLFGLLHVGVPHPAELWTSFPLGALYAAMTLLSGSIWPALLAHLGLNLVPLVVLALAGPWW